MHKNRKPVRKCHGCPLNFIDHCGLFPDPHLQWEHGACKGYKNQELYEQYLKEQAKHPPKPDKERRRMRAAQTRTEPHHDGVRPPPIP